MNEQLRLNTAEMAKLAPQALRTTGYAGPIRLFSAAECADLMKRLTAERRAFDPSWAKGYAVVGRTFYDVATDKRILDIIRPVLGPDIVLWGAQLIRKKGNEVHPFHTDAESSAPDGRFVSFWMGIENTGPSAGLMFVPGSHLFGTTIQEINARRGITRNDSIGAEVLEAAREFVDNPTIEQPPVSEGEALFFDGRAWHGSHNVDATSVRTALLLQYAAADNPVRIPRTYVWPLTFREDPRPPVLVVSGSAPAGVNELATPPRRQGAFSLLMSRVQRLLKRR